MIPLLTLNIDPMILQDTGGHERIEKLTTTKKDYLSKKKVATSILTSKERAVITNFTSHSLLCQFCNEEKSTKLCKRKC